MNEAYMKINTFLVITLVLVTPVFTHSESLEQIRTLALANSRSLAKFNLAIQSSVLDEQAQVYTSLPSVSAGVSASISLWNAGGTPTENILDTFNSGASVSVSQKIFEGGKSLIRREINKLSTESARKEALAEYFNVLNAADSAYYAVLEAQAALAAEEHSLRTAELSLSMAEVRQASGMINQGDYLKALADKEARETTRNQARRSLALSGTKLRSLTGLAAAPQPEEINFDMYEELLQHLGSISDEEADTLYEKIFEILAADNPALAKAALANQKAEKNLSLAKRDYSPSLSASFSTGLNYSPTNGLEASSGRLSLSGSIPLDIWVIANNVEKNKITRDSAALDYISAENNLETELQTALLDCIGQAGSALSSRRAWEYAEKHFDYIMELYRLSQNSVSELSEASVLLSSSRSTLIRAQFGFLQALSTLRSLGAFENEEDLRALLEGETE
jgi:outer membrane protein